MSDRFSLVGYILGRLDLSKVIHRLDTVLVQKDGLKDEKETAKILHHIMLQRHHIQ